MRNIRPNVRAVGQMRSTFNLCRTPKFKPDAVDELRSAFGQFAVGAKKQARQLRRTGAIDAPHGKS